MKKHFILICMLGLLWSAHTHSQIAEAWISMPDSLCPYLKQQQRFQLLQYANAGLTDSIKNNLDGMTVVDSVNLSANFLRVKMAGNATWTLTTAAGMIRLDKTVCAPKCNTISYFYDAAWNLLRISKEPFVVEETDEEKEQHF